MGQDFQFKEGSSKNSEKKWKPRSGGGEKGRGAMSKHTQPTCLPTLSR